MVRLIPPWQLALKLVLVGSLLRTHPTAAQTVDGRVVGDSSHAPLPRVRVLLVDSVARRAVDSTETDSLGAFYLRAPRPGTYAVAFERPNASPTFSRSWRLARDNGQQGIFVLPETNTIRVLSTAAVDQRAVPIKVPGAAPRYPDRLRADRVQGNALVRLVIDPAGRVVPESIEILVATAPEFGAAVRTAALAWRFQPALKFGRQVYQLACLPTTFRLTPGDDRKAQQLDSLAELWGKDGDCPPDAVPSRPAP